MNEPESPSFRLRQDYGGQVRLDISTTALDSATEVTEKSRELVFLPSIASAAEGLHPIDKLRAVSLSNG